MSILQSRPKIANQAPTTAPTPTPTRTHVRPAAAFEVCPRCPSDDGPCRVCGSSGWVEADPEPYHEWRLATSDPAEIARTVAEAIDRGMAPHPDDIEVAREWAEANGLAPFDAGPFESPTDADLAWAAAWLNVDGGYDSEDSPVDDGLTAWDLGHAAYLEYLDATGAMEAAEDEARARFGVRVGRTA